MKLLDNIELETAARKLCEMRGIDPDGTTWDTNEPDASGHIYDVAVYTYNWCLIAKEIKRFNQIMHVL